MKRPPAIALCPLALAATALFIFAGCGTASRETSGHVPDDGGLTGSDDAADGSDDGSTGDDGSTSDDGTAPSGGGKDASTAHDAGHDSGHTSSGVDSGPLVNPCNKRGIAANTPPSSAFTPTSNSPGITWWYNWSNQAASGGAAGFEFDPMIWGTGALTATIPGGSRYLLGFNEPNLVAQSNLTPQQVAQDWPQVEAIAKSQGIPIVSPAMTFCGGGAPCSDPSVTDPYTFLKDFFAACSGCEVDAIAVHWYNCDLPSLQGYIDGNATLAGFVQFGKPIWLTEFSCGASSTVAEQETYMNAAIPYLEANPHVFRYSWFSATPIPNGMLTSSDGSLTALGQNYVALPQNACP
jgi:hypothetical protein